MRSSMLLLLSAGSALAWFGPNVRIDHKNCPPWKCVSPAITVGPDGSSNQPVYVAFEADSGVQGRYVMF
ncbi:MAG: hypothetical protein NTX53_03350, partial [candidate division WOR-3 bacterium]|nr:hypothetical protein [candidate division WOR-3 bacterium]